MPDNRRPRGFHASRKAVAGYIEDMIVDFRSFVARHAGKRRTFDAELVVREALINAAEHGCGYDAAKTVTLDASFDDRGMLELTVSNDGEGFDINEAAARPSTDLAEHGRGLCIIKTLSASAVWLNEGRLLKVTFRPDVQEDTMTVTETSVYAPSEDLNAVNVEQCRLKIMELVQATSGKFVIDLSKVRMVDSKGIGLIIASYNTLQANSRELEITGANDEIRSLFKLMRLDRHFIVS